MFKATIAGFEFVSWIARGLVVGSRRAGRDRGRGYDRDLIGYTRACYNRRSGGPLCAHALAFKPFFSGGDWV